MIDRTNDVAAVERLMRTFPVVAVLGARQVGKTTLAATLAERHAKATHFDLEDPRSVGRLSEPMYALEPLRGLIVLDEVQHAPDIFKVLRVLADRPRRPARFLVLGSATPDLLRQSSESLAGRIAYYELGGLSLADVGPGRLRRLWLRGGFPRAFLARSEAESSTWRRQFVRTYVERDLSSLGVQISPANVQRFFTMLAHYHAQTWNGAELARAFGVTEKTVKHYLDVLASTFMARRLQPFFSNLAKREVKAPKVYLTDSGLLHALLGIEREDDLLGHPKVGASWEGFALAEVVRAMGARAEECFFWAVHTGAELDLLIVRGTERRGFEFKLTDAPKITPSMRSAIDALKLTRLDVIHAGGEEFPLGERVHAVPLARVQELVPPLGRNRVKAPS